MDEDTQDSSINLDGLFTDPDGDPITYYNALGSEHLAVVMDPSHTVTITPDTDWSGTEEILLQAADDENCPTEVSCSVTVNPVNDAPIKLGSLPAVTLLEGQTKDAFNLYEYFDDIDNLDLTFTSTGQDQITVDIKTNGLVRMTAPTGLIGGEEFSELITFKATDSGSLSIEDNSLVTVTDVNQPPVQDLALSNIEIPEDGSDATIKLTDHFSDPDDALQFEITNNLHVDVKIGTDSVVTLTPEADWNGEEQLFVTATDGTNPVLHDDFYVTVTPVNDAPILTGAVFEDVEFDEDDDFTTTATVDKLFDDIDGDNLLYSLDGGDDNLEISLNQDLTVSFEPVRNWFGQMTYKIKATDSEVTVEYEADVEVFSVNDPVVVDSYAPLATAIDIRENDEVIFSIQASDEDGISPNYIWTVNEEAVSTDGNTYTFYSDYTSAGTYVIKVKATDGESDQTVSWSLKVRDMNRDPAITIMSPSQGDEFELEDTISFEAEATDPDGDDITVKWTYNNKPLGNDLTFDKTLVAGEHTIRVVATDGKGGQAEDSITINVKGKETTTGGTTGTTLGGAVLGGLLILVAIIIVVVVAIVAVKMRKPKEPAPPEFPPPPPPTDALAPIPPPPGSEYQGYDQPPPSEPGYGYEPPPPPPY
jgi:hypothetical protein